MACYCAVWMTAVANGNEAMRMSNTGDLPGQWSYHGNSV